MKPEQQIKALAELDGYSHLETSGPWHTWCGADLTGEAYTIPDYLTSYNAIIPLIQKQPKDVQLDFMVCLLNLLNLEVNDMVSCWSLMKLLQATPAQLCEALLRATGKWIES